MNDQTLGRLAPVQLRDIWSSEANDFTPWLAREENLSILGEVLGVELEPEAQERAVGPFRADILCKDIGSGAWVLVENQLERSDHLHLGQLLTYASGLEAVTIVWIAARFTEEHRSTLDWLKARARVFARMGGVAGRYRQSHCCRARPGAPGSMKYVRHLCLPESDGEGTIPAPQSC